MEAATTKVQLLSVPPTSLQTVNEINREAIIVSDGLMDEADSRLITKLSVSYTHLTLPTIYSV